MLLDLPGDGKSRGGETLPDVRRQGNDARDKTSPTSFQAVKVRDVAIDGGGGDDFHDVDGRPRERHAIAAQPLAEGLRLTAQLLQLVLVLRRQNFHCIPTIQGSHCTAPEVRPPV